MYGPITQELLDNGTIYVNESGEILGLAADGTEVCFGYADEFLTSAESLEAYFTEFPTPFCW